MSYFIILSLVFIIITIILYKTNSFPSIFPLLYVGLCLMIASNIMYMMIMSNFRQQWLMKLFSYTFFFKGINKLNIHTIKIISILGETSVLSFFVLLSSALDKKNKFKYYLLLVTIAAYFYITYPDTLYGLYLKINSHDAAEALYAKKEYHLLLYLKQSIIAVCFLCPYVALINYYKRTILLIVKRNLIIYGIALALIEITIIAFSYFGVTVNIFDLTLEILFIRRVPEDFRLSGLLIFSIFTTIVLSVFIIIKSKIFARHVKLSKISVYRKNSSLDKNLRMILHTYKNMFFSFRQLSSIALTDAALLSENTEKCLQTMNQIASNALYMVTNQLEMLRNIDLTAKSVNIVDAINLALEKLHLGGNIKVNINIHSENNNIVADSFYITEMFYTLLVNSVEAVTLVEKPEISVSVFSEDNWFLFEIYDNGAGIDKKLHRKIFKPLVSGKNGSTNWGIGLYYVSKIVAAHKGYIFFESQLKQYTKFQIYMPKIQVKKGRFRRENQSSFM